jgi:hypothetical protein
MGPFNRACRRKKKGSLTSTFIFSSKLCRFSGPAEIFSSKMTQVLFTEAYNHLKNKGIQNVTSRLRVTLLLIPFFVLKSEIYCIGSGKKQVIRFTDKTVFEHDQHLGCSWIFR